MGTNLDPDLNKAQPNSTVGLGHASLGFAQPKLHPYVWPPGILNVMVDIKGPNSQPFDGRIKGIMCSQVFILV